MSNCGIIFTINYLIENEDFLAKLTCSQLEYHIQNCYPQLICAKLYHPLGPPDDLPFLQLLYYNEVKVRKSVC